MMMEQARQKAIINEERKKELEEQKNSRLNGKILKFFI